jgi:hypothetical protein
MSGTKKALLGLVLMALLGGGLWVFTKRADNGVYVERDGLGTEIVRYAPTKVRELVDGLEVCESRGDEKAINWVDRDGTASFGCLQFKPTTFKRYGLKYGFFGEKVGDDWLMTKIFDCELQKQIGMRMIEDKEVDKNNEWPVCWNRIK